MGIYEVKTLQKLKGELKKYNRSKAKAKKRDFITSPIAIPVGSIRARAWPHGWICDERDCSRPATPAVWTRARSPATCRVAATVRPLRMPPRQRKDDVTRQVSWLAALTRPLRLPKTQTRLSGTLERALAAYSCGGSHGIG